MESALWQFRNGPDKCLPQGRILTFAAAAAGMQVLETHRSLDDFPELDARIYAGYFPEAGEGWQRLADNGQAAGMEDAEAGGEEHQGECVTRMHVVRACAFQYCCFGSPDPCCT